MRDGVGAAKQNVEGGGVSRGGLQSGEQVGGFRRLLGSQKRNAEKISGLEVILQRDGFLQFGGRGLRIPVEKIQPAEDIVRASIIRMCAEDGLNRLGGFVSIALAEPCDSVFHLKGGVCGRDLDGLVEQSSSFIELLLGNGKVPEL